MLPSLHAFLLAFGIDVARVGVWLALLAGVFVTIERLFTLRPSAILRPGIWADLGWFFLTSLLPGVLLALPIAMLAAAAHRVTPAAWFDAVAGLPVWVRAAAALVVGEVGFYWGHRWSHEVPLLWRFHAVHHSAEHVDWLVNTRAHPVDLVFGRLCGLAPLTSLGLAAPFGAGGGGLAILILLLGTAWGFFVHANVRWRLGWLESVVATPAFHHWHHTNDRVGRDRNYAALLPVMDRLFGSYFLPRRAWPAAYGVDQPVGGSLAEQLVTPLLPAARAQSSAAALGAK